MLVTRRRIGESLMIGGEVEIQVLEVASNWVKLGITAPRDVSVQRKEVRVVRQENQAAARALDATELDGLVAILRREKNAGAG